jgi:hypothetical protein
MVLSQAFGFGNGNPNKGGKLAIGVNVTDVSSAGQNAIGALQGAAQIPTNVTFDDVMRASKQAGQQEITALNAQFYASQAQREVNAAITALNTHVQHSSAMQRSAQQIMNTMAKHGLNTYNHNLQVGALGNHYQGMLDNSGSASAFDGW